MSRTLPSTFDALEHFSKQFDIELASRSLYENSFDLEEEVLLLVTAMRDPDPNVRLAAQRSYRALLRDLTHANSTQASITRTSLDASGALVRESLSGGSLLTRLRGGARAPGAVPERIPPLSLHPSSPAPTDRSVGDGPGGVLPPGEPPRAGLAEPDPEPQGPAGG